MLRQVTLALTAAVALGAAVVAPTTASAFPVPHPHLVSGPPGGVLHSGFVGLWGQRPGETCHWVTRHYVSAKSGPRIYSYQVCH
jgi:hypothetical protein